MRDKEYPMEIKRDDSLNDLESVREFEILFWVYSEDFGLNDDDHLERQCDYEDKFKDILCRHKGFHDMIPDQCMMPHHDLCALCGITREMIEEQKSGPCSK